jgi:hypothetical protein
MPQGTGDPLHGAFEIIVQQLALQGHPVLLNLLLLRKSFLTLDGIMRQLDPISMPGWKPSRMAPECSQAKPSCEPGAFHSRGSTGPISIVPGCPRERWRLISRARSEKSLCKCTKNLLAVSAIRAMFRSEAQESLEALATKTKKRRTEKT